MDRNCKGGFRQVDNSSSSVLWKSFYINIQLSLIPYGGYAERIMLWRTVSLHCARREQNMKP